ncbi:MAG TPA: nucleoside hydrolase, partial [Chthoniobacterales bacterium]|nr:nucleoside hydrolase [Chthoniobacterales bacterium]
DMGVPVLLERMKEAKWQWVVSNVLDEKTGAPIGDAAPYLIRDEGGMKVGYIGVLLTGNEISPENRRGATFLDPFETTAKLLPRLKQEGAEAIVALTHLNFDDDRRLAERFPEIDVIIGGHEHFPITAMVNRTLISKGGADARFVPRLDLARSAPGASLTRHYELIPITPELPDHAETAAVVAAYDNKLSEALDVVIGTTRTPLDAVAEKVRSAESTAGNFIADAMRAAVDADAALLNGGAIRGNRVVGPGPLKRRDVLALHPFRESHICKVRASGSTILAALNHGVARLGESLGRFPQVSGITFEVDPAAPGGQRVKNARINGEPLDARRQYTLAIGDYVLKGGDGYTMFADAEVLFDPEAGPIMPAVLEQRMRELGEIAPEVEGRVKFTSGVASKVAKAPVLLDTDMGIDSVLGMLYLLKSPEVDVRAVTVVNGIAEVDAGVRNALRILELTGFRDTPVAAGQPRPLRGERGFPSFWREQANTLGGAKLPEMTAKPSAKPAPELIIETLKKSAEPMRIVAMGPLTNIAQALERKPQIASKIKELVVMGGAVGVPGNIDKPFVGIKNSVAEWNFYIDPQAAEAVLKSNVPVRLLSLDSSRALPITPEFLQRVEQAQRDATSELLLELLHAVKDGIEGGWYFFWDTLAAVVAARPDVIGSNEVRVDVITEEGPQLGQTRLAPETGRAVRVAEEINRDAFEKEFLSTVLR